MVERKTSRPLSLTLGLLFYLFCIASLLLLGIHIVRAHRLRYRGVACEPMEEITNIPEVPWGINVSLEQYDDATMRRALSLIREAGFRWVRQRFPWDGIEPERREFQWTKWDHLVEMARQYDLEIIAVLDRSPQWARDKADSDNPLAPPTDTAWYASWASTLAARYRGKIRAYQVWDEPNIWPHWGERPVDPIAYAQLLSAAYEAIKDADPEALVISAGLAPNTEPGGRNMNELQYLQKMYDAGAGAYFDILGAKPYGFWSGPEDRRVSVEVLNFSRLILLREEMARRGDAQKTIWAVELGWNALPENWSGRPSPWGTDSEAKQAKRTIEALRRAREEWPWLGLFCLQHFQPDADWDDPLWGFALVDRNFQPRLLYNQMRDYIASERDAALSASRPLLSRQSHLRKLGAALAILAAGLLIIAWRGYAHFRQLPWATWWHWGERAFLALQDWQQALLLGLPIAVYLWSPWIGIAFLGLWLVLALSYLRLDWVLLYATLSIPFAPLRRPIGIGSKGFSLLETLTLLAFAAWILQNLSSQENERASIRRQRPTRGFLRSWLQGRLSLLTLDWRGLDGAWLFLLLIAVFSLAISSRSKMGNLEASLREFRMVVLESTLFYFLIAKYRLTNKGKKHVHPIFLANALVLSGTMMALYGLFQYWGGGDTIVTEGVRRIRGIYGSPNNLSLLLGRIVPIALALAFGDGPRWRRLLYGGCSAIMLPCLFLTFSRGAWLLGVPASLLFLGIAHGRRGMLAVLAIVMAGALLLIPFANTQRVSSLFDLSNGTTFLRLSLWKSALAMIRDYPITGIGLDSFLYYYPSYILPGAEVEPNLSHPHNIILDYWLRLGIGGLIALVWFLVTFFRKGARLCRCSFDGESRALVIGLMASMVYFAAHGLIDNSYFVVELAFIFALTLGLISSLELLQEEKT